MSNFNCEHCGAMCTDTNSGYINGCEHYPIDKKPRLRGFGVTLDVETGLTRRWVVGSDRVKRWADTMQPCDT